MHAAEAGRLRRPPRRRASPDGRGRLSRGQGRRCPGSAWRPSTRRSRRLTASGLATKLAAGGDGSARYDARGDHHYHLRCLRSGAVEDLPTPFDPDLIAKLDPNLTQNLQRQGFRVTGYRLELVGYFDEETAGAGAPEP